MVGSRFLTVGVEFIDKQTEQLEKNRNLLAVREKISPKTKWRTRGKTLLTAVIYLHLSSY